MSFTLDVFNPDGGLVMSSEGMILGFAGKVPLYQTNPTTQTGVDGDPLFSTDMGDKSYRIAGTADNPPLWFVVLQDGVWMRWWASYFWGGYWTLYVQASAYESGYFGTILDAEVYAFRRPPAKSADAFALRTWDASGRLMVDTGYRPLSLLGYFHADAATGQSNSIASPPSGFTKMALSSPPNGTGFTGPRFPGNEAEWSAFWLKSGTSLSRELKRTHIEYNSVGYGSVVANFDHGPVDVFAIEASPLG